MIFVWNSSCYQKRNTLESSSFSIWDYYLGSFLIHLFVMPLLIYLGYSFSKDYRSAGSPIAFV
jgi:hypothetical protein